MTDDNAFCESFPKLLHGITFVKRSKRRRFSKGASTPGANRMASRAILLRQTISFGDEIVSRENVGRNRCVDDRRSQRDRAE